jgi:peptide/nickel transport system substrate-binding protein
MGDPTAGLQRLYLPQPGPPTKGYTNPTGYSNPEVTKLWNAAAETLNTEERAKNFYAVQVILAEDINTVPVVDTRLKDVARKYVKGIWTGPYEETTPNFWIDK